MVKKSMHLGTYTYRLFALPSFLEGFVRIADIGATLNVYNESPAAVSADAVAIASDWKAVGADITDAINAYERSARGKAPATR